MIHTLPKSLVECATAMLNKTRYPVAYVSFRDAQQDHDSLMTEAEHAHVSEWLNHQDNASQVLDHLSRHDTHTDDDKTHVYRYTSASNPLNKRLYADHVKGVEPHPEMQIKGAYNFTHDIKGIDAAVNRNKLSHDLVSYAGIRWNPKDKMDSTHHVHLPAYTSTSLDKDVAHRFAKSAPGKPSDVHILQIHHPAGSSGLYTRDDPSVTHYSGENEYVVPRNTTINIDPVPHVYKDDDGKNVHVWKAHRVRSAQVDVNYQTPEGHHELYNKDGLKVYRTDTLGALKKHYPDFHANAEDFHAHHVMSPVYHVHTPDNRVWQSNLEDGEGMEDGETVFRPAKGNTKASLNSLVKKYPQISHLKSTLERKDKFTNEE